MNKLILSLIVVILVSCSGAEELNPPTGARIEMKEVFVEIHSQLQRENILVYTCVEYNNPQECINLLKGNNGTDGIVGAPGIPGADGSQGPQGEPGESGEDTQCKWKCKKHKKCQHSHDDDESDDDDNS